MGTVYAVAITAPTMTKPRISIVVAIGHDSRGNHVIGKENRLLWRIGDDLKRFKEITLRHPIIMGRKTFESIGKPLPGRTNIVITRDPSWTHADVTVAHSLQEALSEAKARDEGEIFIIGGAQIYELALPLTDRIYLTTIKEEKDGDVFFPPFEDVFTKKTFEEKRFDEKTGLHYTWSNLERA